MRKFRFWETYMSRMRYDYVGDNIKIDYLGQIIGLGCPQNIPLQLVMHNNNSEDKPIYESDIIRCWNNSETKSPFIFESPIVGVIAYIENGFYLKVDGSYLNHWQKADNIEVIGNIYEHPNLIK